MVLLGLRIESPLEDVPLNDVGAPDAPVCLALFEWPDVDEQRAAVLVLTALRRE